MWEPFINFIARNAAENVVRQKIGSAWHSKSHRRGRQQQISYTSDPNYATMGLSGTEDPDEMYAEIAELQTIYDSNAGSGIHAMINDDRSHDAASPPAPISSTANSSIAVPWFVGPPSFWLLPLLVVLRPMEAERVCGSSPIPPTFPSVVFVKQLSTKSTSSRLNGKLFYLFFCISF